MSLHRACCCGDAPICADTCTGCCDGCASSYYSGAITWSGQWEVLRPHIIRVCPGDPCIGNNEETAVEEWNVSITLTIPAGTITRQSVDGGCCYMRNGAAAIHYQIDYQCSYANYVPNPDVCCDYFNALIGTLDTTFCHTVTPCCVSNQCKWHHAVQVCGGFIGEMEKILETLTVGMLDCDDAKERVPLYLGGAQLAWISKYEPLNQLSWNEFTYLGHCPQCTVGCVNPTDNGNCPGYDEAALQNTVGPFSIYRALPNQLDVCDPAGIALVQSFNQCKADNSIPLDQWDSICYESHDNSQLPCCTSDFEPISLNGPLYT
jgi:hypothetical protein